MLVGNAARAATSSSANPDKSAEIVMESAWWARSDFMVSGTVLNEGTHRTVMGSFNRGKGGVINEVFQLLNTNNAVIGTNTTDSILSTNGTSIIAKHIVSNYPGYSLDYYTNGGSYTIAQEIGALSWHSRPGVGTVMGGDKSSEVCMMLHTGGKAGSTKKHLFVLSAGATEETTWGLYPWDVFPTQIFMAGKKLNDEGVAYAVFPDHDDEDCTPDVNVPCYSFFNLGADKQCAPRKITFSDTSADSSSFWPNHVRGKLEAVCNPGTTNYTVLASINWEYDIDANGHTTTTNQYNGGYPGDVGVIVATLSGFDKGTAILPGGSAVVSGEKIEAYYIGCCEAGDLSWVHTILEDLHPKGTNSPPYNDTLCSHPYYYCPEDTSFIQDVEQLF